MVDKPSRRPGQYKFGISIILIYLNLYTILGILYFLYIYIRGFLIYR